MGADGSLVRGAETDEFPFGWNSRLDANWRIDLLKPIQYAPPHWSILDRPQQFRAKRAVNSRYRRYWLLREDQSPQGVKF